MLFHVPLLLLIVYQSAVAEDLCQEITGSDLVFKCDGCHEIVLCLGSTLFDTESCNEKYCHYDADSEMADCLSAVPAGCEDVTTTTEEPTTTTVSTSTSTEETTTVEPATTSTPLPEEITTITEITTSSPAESTTLPNTAILCTGFGIYPDPYECNRYHYCPGAGVQSWDQLCPPNYGFAYKSAALSSSFPCKLNAFPSDCTPIDCSTPSIFKPFASSKLHYAYCYTEIDSHQPTISVFKCSEGATFDGTTCVFNCLREGLFANTVTPATYYQCYFSKLKLVSRLVQCPAGKKFVEDLKTCV